jgi:hypothetical protein
MREKVLVCCLLVFLLCGISLGSHAASPTVSTVSGSFPTRAISAQGTSDYVLQYSFPDRATVGTSLNVTVVLTVVELTGLKTYIANYSSQVLLLSPQGAFVAQGRAAAGQILFGGETTNATRFIYPGGHWGPVNITIPLKESSFNLAPGASQTDNVSIGFVANVWYNPPEDQYLPDSGSSTVGSITVTNTNSTSQSSSNLDLLIGVGAAAAVIVLLTAVVYVSKSRKIKQI